MNLNQYQIKALEEMRDSRAISPELLSAFAEENGALNAFLVFAQEHEELNICFRGNNNAIKIYYLNHLVWKLTPGRKGYYRVTFNFGQARGMLKEHDYLCSLKNCGFKLASDEKHIYWEKDLFTKEDINAKMWPIFKEIMDWYYDPSIGNSNMKKVKKDYKILSLRGEELQYSSKFDCVKDDKENVTIHIHETTANMQEDSSDFESIIVWIWSIDRKITVTLKYDSYSGKDDKSEYNRDKIWKDLIQPYYVGLNGQKYAEPARLHYMRFLYRVMRFRERYQKKGFILDISNVDEIEKFEEIYKEALLSGEIWITKPTVEGGLKGYDKATGSFNHTGEVTENHLEKYFVQCSKNNKLPEQITKEFGNNRLYDQLPCCLFYGEPSSSTRIFNAGYFDLWGINDKDELCVFELKKEGNSKLGIISELFFYAMLMRDMKQATKNKYSKIKANHRGFKDFVECPDKGVVNAYFLVPQLHSALENPGVKSNFISVLNECNDGINFGVIEFSQDEIIGSSVDSFLRSLANDMK